MEKYAARLFETPLPYIVSIGRTFSTESQRRRARCIDSLIDVLLKRDTHTTVLWHLRDEYELAWARRRPGQNERLHYCISPLLQDSYDVTESQQACLETVHLFTGLDDALSVEMVCTRLRTRDDDLLQRCIFITTEKAKEAQ